MDLSNYKIINISFSDFNNEEHLYLVDKKLTQKEIKQLINKCIQNTNEIVKDYNEAESWYLQGELSSKDFIEIGDIISSEYSIEDKFLQGKEKILYRKVR